MLKVPSSPTYAYVESDKIARAIDNLLMNALKYSYKPGIIELRMKAYSTYILIEIENEGNPLQEDQANKLFDRFYKVDFSRSSEGIQTGFGLGLSIARNITELHQGGLTLHHAKDIFLFKMVLPILHSKE
ncbi:Sensor protein kinase WalK [compost metagenome]